jgi:hypothetical protein
MVAVVQRNKSIRLLQVYRRHFEHLSSNSAINRTCAMKPAQAGYLER